VAGVGSTRPAARERDQVLACLRLAAERPGAGREEAREPEALHPRPRDGLRVPRQEREVVAGGERLERLGRSRCRLPVRGRRPREQLHVALGEDGAPPAELRVDRRPLEPFAEQQVAQALHRGLAGTVLGAGEAVLGQAVPPDLEHAGHERVEVHRIGREEERPVDVEENEGYTVTLASRADRSDAT
jgi:hypothetical protein